ncbi:MAG: fahA [Aeromicrobium sp.]|jgi:fumarylacetoacetase|uniref:fumarylacetoacetase n=1 Tax=Aeromicrobium sp. TaxID=1871063 RepID=UPI0026158D95|nr:fumarylacetoacetase [Aeromicrobium sp.]MCW2788781.1 fahA [Aeromicrobium sp.]MCW2823398.1 fahA [Aeromicrobium sp.]
MTDFGRTVLPYGSFVRPGETRARVGVGVGAAVLDLTAAAGDIVPEHAALFAGGTLDALLGAGPDVWHDVRAALLAWAEEADASTLEPAADVDLVLPFTVADYVDFYASEHHATNVGRIFRPDGDALTPNWKHLPIGYHGRAGTVVPSGTPVRRPQGQARRPDGTIGFGPSERLDIEAEIGFIVGTPSRLGDPVPVEDFDRHVFGICVVNDWSARDIQAWEYVPLGPFLGKSFATSVSPWVVPLAALDGARVDPPARDPEPLPYLRDAEPWALDLELIVSINGTAVSRAPFAGMYWTGAQMLAHLTVNGASLRTGDLFASGTVSGPEPDQRGSLLEMSWNGTQPLELADGTSRAFLLDGDHVTIAATARLADGSRLALGEVHGEVTA